MTEQATGILAERAGLDVAGALSKLRQFARDHDLRVVEVTRGVVDGTIDVEGDSGTS